MNDEVEKQEQKADIPDRLWTKADICEYLGYKEATVNRIICKPAFPKAMRGDDGRAHPRWFPEEIRAWAKSQRRKVA